MTSTGDILNSHKNNCFPRGINCPSQSPKYWAREKDRYLRQLLIQDIQDITGRPLFVYYAQINEAINYTDPDDLIEILSGVEDQAADLLIHTPGGDTNATEKLICILRQKFSSLRVIVPALAKSAGTVIALSAETIILGLNSELGPIDPHFGDGTPCEILANDESVPYRVRETARLAVIRTRELAKKLLQDGVMRDKTVQNIDDVLKKISGVEGYKSHGAVIDYVEANALGLNVIYLEPENDLWKKIWLLYCLYDVDTKEKKIGRIIEGKILGIARPPIAEN